jgi:hypothetical protein
MRMTKEALATVILVRRVRIGAAPFSWEVHRAGNATPIHISSDRYKSMEAAYRAGQARLEEFIPKRSMPPGVTRLRLSQAGHVGLDAMMQE